MNEGLLAAGGLALLGAAIHGLVGDRIVRRIRDESLPGNPFRGISTKFLIRITWHFVTVAFFVLGVALVFAGSRPSMSAATGIAYVAGAAYICWSVLGLVGGVRHAGLSVLRAHPAPIVFLVMVALIWWGEGQL